MGIKTRIGCLWKLTLLDLNPTNFYPQQNLILAAPENGFLVVTGGAGTYKTTGCIIKLYTHLIENPSARIMVLMQTETQLDMVFMHEWRNIVPEQHYERTKNSKYWSYNMISGAEMMLQYADHPKTSERIIGANMTGYYISQAETLTHESLITQLELRKRGRKHGKLLFRMLDANGGIPTRPAIERYVEHGSDRFVCGKGKVTLTKDFGDIRIYSGNTIEGDTYNHIWVKSTSETSEYNDLELEQLRVTSSETDYQRMIEGKNVASEGLVYKKFDRNIHVSSFKINTDLRWYGGIDWGYENPAVCLFCSVDSDDNIWLFDEIYVREHTPEELGKLIQGYVEKNGIRPMVYYADPSNKGAIRSLNQMRLPVLKGWNSVDSGIDKVRTWLQQGKLHVHERCVNTIREFTSYESKSARQGDSRSLENPKKENDHAMDALRYIIATLWR